MACGFRVPYCSFCFCWLATSSFWAGVKLRFTTSQGFKLEAGARDNLVSHMGAVHAMVTDAADDYRLKMRRHVYQVWPHRHQINQRAPVRTSVGSAWHVSLVGSLAFDIRGFLNTTRRCTTIPRVFRPPNRIYRSWRFSERCTPRSSLTSQ